MKSRLTSGRQIHTSGWSRWAHTKVGATKKKSEYIRMLIFYWRNVGFSPLYSLIINNNILNHYRPYFDSYFHEKKNTEKCIYTRLGCWAIWICIHSGSSYAYAICMDIQIGYMIFSIFFFFSRIRQSKKDASIHRTSIHAQILYTYEYIFENSLSKYLFIELTENAERIHPFCVFFAGKKADYTNSNKAGFRANKRRIRGM